MFSSIPPMLFRPCRPKLGRPPNRIWPNSLPLRVMAPSRKRLTVLPRKNINSRMQKLTPWLSAVATPAPAVPIPKPKISTGSSRIFRMPPVTSPIMARFALPS